MSYSCLSRTTNIPETNLRPPGRRLRRNQLRIMTSLITHITLADLVKTALSLSSAGTSAATPPQNDSDTPVLRSISEARGKGYECVGLPLTNDSWRTRWQDMCVLPPGEKPDRHSLEMKAEQWRVRPCFTRDEVNVTKLGTLNLYMPLYYLMYSMLHTRLCLPWNLWCCRGSGRSGCIRV